MKIYLVPLNNNRDINSLVLANSKYTLISFAGIKSRKDGATRWKELLDENFLLDSGAFTFMNSQKNAKIDWDKYIEEYADFINKNNIELFFELDIDVIVGISEVERLRSKLETLTGKKCIPVWHKSRGVAYWKTMCDKYDYVAIGGLVTKEITEKEYPVIKNMVNYAKQKGVRVHGLGFTNMKWLKQIKWYSVDSTSWKGTLFSYRFFQFNGKEVKAKAVKGLDLSKYWVLVNQNAVEWVKFQSYADYKL